MYTQSESSLVTHIGLVTVHFLPGMLDILPLSLKDLLMVVEIIEFIAESCLTSVSGFEAPTSGSSMMLAEPRAL